ncbi:tyrosine-type recombinase/integrase [Leptolyngbya sp. NIES-2104]|uniref:tyrosine-type recombinase/integrase n=1 Tax=Leptolyngbya sp. NIES-2104 TaxID=1552121 RepID=UPI0006ECC6FE|nr:tyrosine-type recombinase/integrase [Leptolyngbya sp. NIES-2104]GAP99836.1 probable DNA recombinase [Leptolyngbya sp. NIES-2104]
MDRFESSTDVYSIIASSTKNEVYRSREYLIPNETLRLIEVAGERSRHRLRDRTLLLMFRHGLRTGEASRLKWDAVMLNDRNISITRLKGSQSGIHRLQTSEIKALEQLKERYPGNYHLFVGERDKKLATGAIAKIMKCTGELADLPLPIHPHMLRHSCGYYLAEQGLPTRDIQKYLGHKNIQHTVRYTAANPARFDRINWQLVEILR